MFTQPPELYSKCLLNRQNSPWYHLNLYYIQWDLMGYKESIREKVMSYSVSRINSCKIQSGCITHTQNNSDLCPYLVSYMLHKYIERAQWHKWWELPTSWWQTWHHSTAGLQRVTPTCYNIWMQVSSLFKENWRNWKSIKYIDQMVIHWFFCIYKPTCNLFQALSEGVGVICTSSWAVYQQILSGVCWCRFLDIWSTGSYKLFTTNLFQLHCPAWLWVAILVLCIFLPN